MLCGSWKKYPGLVSNSLSPKEESRLHRSFHIKSKFPKPKLVNCPGFLFSKRTSSHPLVKSFGKHRGEIHSRYPRLDLVAHETRKIIFYRKKVDGDDQQVRRIAFIGYFSLGVFETT